MSKAVDKFLSNDCDEFEDKLENLEECNDTIDGSKAILKQLGYSDSGIGKICQWFELDGGYCDCEVHLNIVLKDKEYGRT